MVDQVATRDGHFLESTVFGLSAEAGRWGYVFLGLVINLCLGTVYSWSVFKKPVETLFHTSATMSSLPFMIFLAAFALVMPFGGRLVQKYGPRLIGIIGAVIASAGWILSGFAQNVTMLIFTYGIIGGAGVGLAYGGPIAVAAKWFPDRKGLAVGLTVAGFGISALITAPLARYMIETMGALRTFYTLGMVFMVIMVLLTLPLQFPKADWAPRGWKAGKAAAAAVNVGTAGMFKTSSFYALWLCFVIGTTAGLMAIGIASPVGQETIKLNAATATLLVSVFAIFNGAGRPAFGWLTDRLTPVRASALSFVLIILASLGMLFAGAGSTVVYILCFSAFWLCLGGWLAIAPTATATYFGNKDYSVNYGVVFTGYGIGAIVGNLVAGQARDIFGSYTFAFYPTAALGLVGLVLSLTMLKPGKK